MLRGVVTSDDVLDESPPNGSIVEDVPDAEEGKVHCGWAANVIILGQTNMGHPW